MKVTVQFYDRTDVIAIARELLGKIIVTRFDGLISSGRIVKRKRISG